MTSKNLMTCVALATALLAPAAFAQGTTPVAVDGAWARASVAGQKSSGAFMKLTAKSATRLVGVSTPVAGIAEVHEMKMEGDIMRMRAVPGIDLAAGQTLELKPGGYHVMLLDLKTPLQKDSVVPLTLTFRDSKGVETRQELKVPVALTAPGAVAGGMKDMGHGAHKH
jgi:hypothetical protein